jgi:hypothetical protein
MEQSEQNVIPATAAPATSLSAPEVRKQEQTGTGNSIFDVKNMSIFYSAFKAVTDVSMTIY